MSRSEDSRNREQRKPISHIDRQDPRWGEEFQFASKLFGEAGVEVNLYNVPGLHARNLLA
jgi:hypothetical protein